MSKHNISDILSASLGKVPPILTHKHVAIRKDTNTAPPVTYHLKQIDIMTHKGMARDPVGSDDLRYRLNS
jgi:hypothetical protein